jgi:CO dehydrogenase maturation factor
MQIAVAGKGGSGKTTIAGTLARILAQRGRSVRAIDGDSNPNLAVAVGVEPSRAFSLPGLPSTLLQRETDELGNRLIVLTKGPLEIFDEFGIDAPDGIRLLVGSRIDHAGSG